MLKNTMFNRCLALVLSLAAACGAAMAIPSGEDVMVYRNVLRLHVVANSDSPADQSLKYAVRDEVAAVCRILLKDCDNIARAREIIGANLGVIEQTAAKAIASGKSNAQKNFYFREKIFAPQNAYSTKAALLTEFYPTRDYGAFRLPAGRYSSLKITLGEGRGKNWWCVLYPSLCFSAALDDSGIKIVSAEPGTAYEIKFRILELASEWLNRKKPDSADKN